MTACLLLAVAAARLVVPLADDWRFVKGDDPKIGTNYTLFAMSDTLDRAFRGDLSGAPEADWCRETFDDSAWCKVRVPHDWGVMTGFDPSLPYGDAFLPVSGIGWYRRAFSVKAPKDGVVYFECDGAMSYAHVWVNGRFAGGWPYGYTRWRLDVTRFLHPGENVIAVRCHNVVESSRWYSGGGLYRACRLLVCPKDHVVPGSVAITTPEVTARRARVCVRYRMSVSGPREKRFTVENPRLWDVDDPYLHSVDVEGETYRYGIRTIAFHADERRFQLNGRTVPLNGVSMHHDFGVLGAAWNRAAQKRRLLAFKEAGVNAIRSSHNPPDEGLLDLCDELGLLVKDEAFDEWRYMGNAGKRVNGYHNIFDVWHERDLRAWVRTDRNHPCVILWSLGNEICDGHEKIAPHAEFVARAWQLSAIVTSEDPTRPTTNANNNPVNYTNDFPSVLAVMGCNYFPWQYPRLKKAWPDVPFYGSETICTGSTRGEYRFPVLKRSLKQSEFDSFYMTSYVWESCGWNSINGGWACPPDAQWYWMDQVKTCLGEFIWTGIDYLGGPYWCTDFRKKPRFADPERQKRALEDVKKFGMARDIIHTCDCGFLDQACFRKDSFYLFQSRWRPNLPMAHILPHWNWPERVGKVTPVYVFTSGDEAELFLNGVSLGRRRKVPGEWDKAYRLCWDDVRYAPGELVAVAYKGGREWARDRVRTTGPAAQLRLEPETRVLAADGDDLAFVNVSLRDARGDVVPRSRNPVSFALEGPGEIVATDNGDETNADDFHQPRVRIFNGWAQAIVRAKKGAKGRLVLTATSPDLPSASVTLDIASDDRANGLDCIDPLIGTEGTGSQYGGMMPYTCVPFGSFHLVPMTRHNRVGQLSFNQADDTLIGFILTRQSAIWMGDWGEVRIPIEPAKIERLESTPYRGRLVAGGRRFDYTATAHAAWIRGDLREIRLLNGFNANRDDENLGYPLPNFKGWRYVRRRGSDLQIGVSLISLEQARENLAREIGAKSFEQVVAETKAAWQTLFDRVVIDAPQDVKTIFYTGLFHTLLYPREISEFGRYYSPMDDRVHNGVAYTCYSLWDTYRAEHPWLTLVAPERVDGMMQGLLNMYREGGWLPKWPNPSYTGIMIGSPAEVVLAEAWVKGFRGFDLGLAYEAVRKNAMVPQRGDGARAWEDRGLFGRDPETRGGLKSYMERGYVACDETAESVSRTQDFGLDDMAAAILAEATGHADDARLLRARAKNYTNLWNAAAQEFHPRLASGRFAPPSYRTKGAFSAYCEQTAKTGVWAVPFDTDGLASLMGGRDKAIAKLDAFFRDEFWKSERGNKSIHGNEPSHHCAYLYNRWDAPEKTQRQVREILTRSYSTNRKGFDGNEDCGQMSAWYLFSALGFYPLDPASGEYEIGSPLVRGATLRLGSATLRIRVANYAPDRWRVRKVALNGRTITNGRLAHADLVKGGELVFEMADEP